MPDYRRQRVPGGTYFFTVNLRDRRSDPLVREIAALRRAVRQVRARFPFQIDAWVVLPDHALPVDPPRGRCRLPPSLAGDQGEFRGIWRRRYWEHTIRDDRDSAMHVATSEREREK